MSCLRHCALDKHHFLGLLTDVQGAALYWCNQSPSNMTGSHYWKSQGAIWYMQVMLFSCCANVIPCNWSWFCKCRCFNYCVTFYASHCPALFKGEGQCIKMINYHLHPFPFKRLFQSGFLWGTILHMRWTRFLTWKPHPFLSKTQLASSNNKETAELLFSPALSFFRRPTIW